MQQVTASACAFLGCRPILLGGFCTRCGNPTADPTKSMPTTPATTECFADMLHEHKALITRLQEWVTRLQAENATLEAQVKSLKAKPLKRKREALKP